MESFELNVSANEEAGDFNEKEVNVTFVICTDVTVTNKNYQRVVLLKKWVKFQKRNRKATQYRKTCTKVALEDIDKVICNEKVIVTKKIGGVNRESKTSKIPKQMADLAREENSQEKRLRGRSVKGTNDNSSTSQVPLVTKQLNYESLKDPVEKKKSTIYKRVAKETVPAKRKVSKRHISLIPVDNKQVNDNAEEPVQKRKRSKVQRVCIEVLSPSTMVRLTVCQKPKEMAPVKTLPASENKSVRVHIEHW